MDFQPVMCRYCFCKCCFFPNWSRLMFSKMQWDEILCFLDDLTIPCITIEQGMQLLQKAFDCIRVANLRLKPAKCKLFQTSAKVLGMVVNNGTVTEDLVEPRLVKDWPFPRTVKELRKFLGFCGYGRQFYPEFSRVVQSLTACLKKGA
jgi:hypothetical protein